MIPGKYDLTIYRGATFGITFEAKDASLVSVDFDAVYDDFRVVMRPPWVKGIPSTTAALKTLTLANGGIVLQGSNLQILLTMTAAETAALTFSEGIYELELIKDATANPAVAEIIDKLVYGSVTVVGEV